jgi:hypothetical protein
MADGQLTSAESYSLACPQAETQLEGAAPGDSAAGHVEIDWVAVYAPQG